MGNLSDSHKRWMMDWLGREYHHRLQCLTSRQLECVLLIYVDGYTEEEAAERLGITQPAVSKHKSMGIQKLKEMFHS
jgi:DNA-directed RNA polymerase specialized sigma24 family protein